MVIVDGRRERTRRHRMVHDGEPAAGVGAIDLPADSEAAEVEAATLIALNDRGHPGSFRDEKSATARAVTDALMNVEGGPDGPGQNTPRPGFLKARGCQRDETHRLAPCGSGLTRV